MCKNIVWGIYELDWFKFFPRIFCPDNRSYRDTEIFVHKYFQENERKKIEEDLFCCLTVIICELFRQYGSGVVPYLHMC